MVSVEVRAIIAILVGLSAPAARAIVLHADPTVSEQRSKVSEMAPFPCAVPLSGRAGVPAFPYWDHVGMVGLGSGIYLGDGWILTSAHVGCLPFKMADGSIHKPMYGSWRILRNSDGGKSDLALFKVLYGESSSLAKLEPIPISGMARTADMPVIIVGTGYVEKESVAGVPASKVTLGYNIHSVRKKRWALATVDKAPSRAAATAGGYKTWSFSSTFQRNILGGQAAEGDSGGAAFTFDPKDGQWKLVGCIFAVSQLGRYVPFGARTYLADLEMYRWQLAVASGTDPRVAGAE